MLGAEALAASVESAVPQVLAHLKQETSLVLAHLKQDPAQIAGRPPADLDLGGDDSGRHSNTHTPLIHLSHASVEYKQSIKSHIKALA